MERLVRDLRINLAAILLGKNAYDWFVDAVGRSVYRGSDGEPDKPNPSLLGRSDILCNIFMRHTRKTLRHGGKNDIC